MDFRNAYLRIIELENNIKELSGYIKNLNNGIKSLKNDFCRLEYFEIIERSEMIVCIWESEKNNIKNKIEKALNMGKGNEQTK